MLGLCPLCGENKPCNNPVTIMVNRTATEARVCDGCLAQLTDDHRVKRVNSRSKTLENKE